MKNPYQDLESRSFWRTAVAEAGTFGLKDLWRPAYPIRKSTKIITAGSCFAQNISSRLVAQGYSWIDKEPGPEFASPHIKKKYNYGVFSFRTGNIYTARMLRQWIAFAFGEDSPRIPPILHDGRFYDPYRQQIELEGFGSAEELNDARYETLLAIREAFTECDVFFFTLGLTEAWQHIPTGQEYSACPGVSCGLYDPSEVRLINHTVRDIVSDIRTALGIVNRNRKTRIRSLLTVSPVPLTATATNDHVLVATNYSKSVLRAAAGELSTIRRWIDYYPSFEIITSPVSRGAHYAGNLRSITQDGVDHVLSHFFSGIRRFDPKTGAINESVARSANLADEDVVCEEVILNAFSK
jgi:hypothetical protein